VTWRERTVCIILLIVARVVAGDASLSHDLKNLSNRISVSTAEEERIAA
jgi:hypothetical protein